SPPQDLERAIGGQLGIFLQRWFNLYPALRNLHANLRTANFVFAHFCFEARQKLTMFNRGLRSKEIVPCHLDLEQSCVAQVNTHFIIKDGFLAMALALSQPMGDAFLLCYQRCLEMRRVLRIWACLGLLPVLVHNFW